MNNGFSSTRFCFHFHKRLGGAANGHPVSRLNRSPLSHTFLTILIWKKQSSVSITPVEMHDTGREETLGLPLWDLWDT